MVKRWAWWFSYSGNGRKPQSPNKKQTCIAIEWASSQIIFNVFSDDGQIFYYIPTECENSCGLIMSCIRIQAEHMRTQIHYRERKWPILEWRVFLNHRQDKIDPIKYKKKKIYRKKKCIDIAEIIIFMNVSIGFGDTVA